MWIRSLITLVFFGNLSLYGDDLFPISVLDRTGKKAVAQLGFEDQKMKIVRDQKKIPLHEIQTIFLPKTIFNPPISSKIQCIQLPDQDRIHGEWVAIQDSFRFQTTWGESVTLPHGAIENMAPPGDGLPIAVEDFEGETASWQLRDGAEITSSLARSGKKSLILAKSASRAVYVSPRKISQGRMTVGFRDHALEVNPCLFQMIFVDNQTKENTPKPRETPISIQLSGKMQHYKMQTSLPSSRSQPIARSAGWHRLLVEWNENELIVSIDAYILWVGKMPTSGLSFSRTEITSEANASQPQANQTILFDDFGLWEIPKQKLPKRLDWTQDELVRLEGDQCYGQITRLTDRGIEFQMFKQKKFYPWQSMRAVRCQNQEIALTPLSGLQVRLTLAMDYPWTDELRGTLLKIDPKTLYLHHAILGELKIPIERVRMIQLLYQGEYKILIHRATHLGEHFQPKFQEPTARGLSFDQSLDIQAANGKVTLLLSAIYRPTENLKPFQRDRISLSMNEKMILDLVPLLSEKFTHEKILRIPIEKQFWQKGKNTIKIRTEQATPCDCEIRWLAVEAVD